MTFDRFKEDGRTLCIQFECYRCKQIAYRTAEECRPKDREPTFLRDMEPPICWGNTRKYGYLLCPECKQKFDAFIKGEPAE